MSSTLPPPPSGGGGMTINFKNNCIICLQPEKPERMLEILNINPKNLRTFQPIVHYLTGTDPTFGRSQEECASKDLPVMRNLPPLCTCCYEITSDIYRLHAELLKLQLLIQQKTEGLRKVVAGTWRYRKGRSVRNLFLERLKMVGMGKREVKGMESFLEKFHGRIQRQGGRKVIFPSHPPPNYLPLPKETCQPLVLLQIPVQQPPKSSMITSTTTPSFVTTATSVPPANPIPPPPIRTTAPSTPAGVTIPRIIKTSALHTASKGNPLPTTTLVSSTTSTTTPRVSRLNAKSVSSSITSTVSAASTRSSDVVMIPGRSATIKFENEMGEEEDEGEEGVEEMVLASEVTVKEEEDSDMEWEMEDTSDSDVEPTSPSSQKRRCASQSAGSRPSKTRAPEPATLPSIVSGGAGRRKQVLITRDQQQQPPPPSSEPKGEWRLKRPEKVECELCDESMLPILLPSHISSHLTPSSGSTSPDTHHHCRCCRRTFLSRSKLLLHWHIRQCGNELRRQNKDFIEDADVICPNCPPPSTSASTPSKYNVFQYRHHVFATHEKDASLPRIHGCPLCTSRFRTGAGLDYHLNVHCHKRHRYSSWQLDICPPGTSLTAFNGKASLI